MRHLGTGQVMRAARYRGNYPADVRSVRRTIQNEVASVGNVDTHVANRTSPREQRGATTSLTAISAHLVRMVDYEDDHLILFASSDSAREYVGIKLVSESNRAAHKARPDSSSASRAGRPIPAAALETPRTGTGRGNRPARPRVRPVHDQHGLPRLRAARPAHLPGESPGHGTPGRRVHRA